MTTPYRASIPSFRAWPLVWVQLFCGHECVVYNRSEGAVKQLQSEGAVGVYSLEGLVARLMPVSIVVILETVDIDHHQGERVVIPLAPENFPGQVLLKIAVIAQATQPGRWRCPC